MQDNELPDSDKAKELVSMRGRPDRRILGNNNLDVFVSQEKVHSDHCSCAG